MTVLVGVRCSNGVVVGADGSTTFTAGQQKTIEQPTKKKIVIIRDHVIVACSGYVGHAQRFSHLVERLWDDDSFKNKGSIDIGKMLSREGIQEFQQTYVKDLNLSVLVACSAKQEPLLCELPGTNILQPEIKDPDDIWYVSVGSGQPIVDPFLGFLRSIFWEKNPPNLRGGIFMTLWALRHACEVNPGGINEPISIAVLERKKENFKARLLSEEELKEHRDMVKSATDHMASFQEILLGQSGATEVPRPKS